MVRQNPKIDPLIALTPLKVLVVAEKQPESNGIPALCFTAIARAFQGGMTQLPDGSDQYYAMGDDLGVDVRRLIFGSLPQGAGPPDVPDLLRSCGHLLVVILVDGTASADSPFGIWLDKLAKEALSATWGERLSILPVAMDAQGELASLGDFNEFQRLALGDLGEQVLRPGHLGLLVLQRAWTLLGTNADESLKLFISHAKRDGAPLARSVKSHVESLKWLRRFYDADDILPGTQWRRVLENGVKSSILVILRTDIYEQRAWCVQEMQWAEEFGCPTVIVDVRQSLSMPREALPVSGLATVRIPDGNLMRVLNGALREAVRLRLFRRTVELLQRAGSLPRGTLVAPKVSLSALGIACEMSWKTSTEPVRAVVVPYAFAEFLRPVAERLVRAYFPRAKFGVPRDFV